MKNKYYIITDNEKELANGQFYGESDCGEDFNYYILSNFNFNLFNCFQTSKKYGKKQEQFIKELNNLKGDMLGLIIEASQNGFEIVSSYETFRKEAPRTMKYLEDKFTIIMKNFCKKWELSLTAEVPQRIYVDKEN